MNPYVYRNQTNATILTFETIRGWTVPFIIHLSISCVSLLSNLAVLMYHCIRPAEVTHFTIYLLIIFITNVVNQAMVRTTFMIAEIYSSWRWSNTACLLYVYLDRVLGVVTILDHVLISINRLWAVLFPLSYRDRHNKKMAMVVCGCMVIYVHIITMPIYILFIVFIFPWNNENGCRVTDVGVGNFLSMPAWHRATVQAEHVINHLLPVVFVLTAYVFLTVKWWKKRRARQSGMAAAPVAVRPVLNGEDRVGSPLAQNHGPIPQNPQIPRRTIKPFVVLSLTCLSVIVCWVPADAYFFCGAFLNIRPIKEVYEAIGILYAMQSIFDPVMWFFSLRKT